MAYKPWMTSRDLIASVKRKIAMPTAQTTFSDDDILAFANEEMQISQVPSVLQYHEEYFVYGHKVPLTAYVSKYPIPSRAIGMKLRDLMYADAQGNLVELSRINDGEKAYFQRSLGARTTQDKFFVEGNDVVLTPSLEFHSNGSLFFYYFLRPNQLVQNSRASIVQSFLNTVTLDNSKLTAGDILTVSYAQNAATPLSELFTVVNKSITSNSIAAATVITVPVAHGQTIGSTFRVVISEVSGSSPSINGTYTATATGTNTFSIPVTVTVGGSGGCYALDNEFCIGSTSTSSALNLVSALTNVLPDFTSSSSSGTVSITSDDLTLEITATQTVSGAFTYDNSLKTINFDQLPATWQNPTTLATESLFTVNSTVDFLQTDPGHRTYKFDVQIQSINGTSATFNTSDLKVLASNGPVAVEKVINLRIGDYICLQHECIIPQIPPDLHNGLAERTAARILAAQGDAAGLQMSQAKIQEIDLRQGNLLDDRVENAPKKISSRKSLLRYGRYSRYRRY